jgi:hypothetical protein
LWLRRGPELRLQRLLPAEALSPVVQSLLQAEVLRIELLQCRSDLRL